MKKLIELHDSSIKAVEIHKNILSIDFDPLVVLHVTDAFGFEFEKTEYLKGIIQIHNFSNNSLSPGVLFDGCIHIEECQYKLIPTNFKAHGNCALILSNASGRHQILGNQIEIKVTT